MALSAAQRYVYYRDLNGMSSIEAIRGINPFWEGDYATVYFSFVPPNGEAYTKNDIYLFGQLTNYNFTDSLKMIFNPENKKYETHLFMKQGYYDYTYLSVDKNNPAIYSELDGNYYETENHRVLSALHLILRNSLHGNFVFNYQLSYCYFYLSNCLKFSLMLQKSVDLFSLFIYFMYCILL